MPILSVLSSVVHQASSTRHEHSRANFVARVEVARDFYKDISLLYYTVSDISSVAPYFRHTNIYLILQRLRVNIPLSYKAL